MQKRLALKLACRLVKRQARFNAMLPVYVGAMMLGGKRYRPLVHLAGVLWVNAEATRAQYPRPVTKSSLDRCTVSVV